MKVIGINGSAQGRQHRFSDKHGFRFFRMKRLVHVKRSTHTGENIF